MKVIITGSLGHIGKPLAEELLQKGHAVTVISSKVDKQKDIESLGATAAIGSLENIDFLVQTFTCADTVFAMVPPNFSVPDIMAYYRQLGNNYAQAVQQAGVKHVVYLSSYGAHLDRGTGFILGAHHVENILNKLTGVAVTHLRPGYFYYNLDNFKGMIKEAGIMGSNFGGDDKIVMVDPKDIAAAAAEEIVAGATANKIRYIASDEHTAGETAQIIGAAIGKPDLQWLTFTNEQTQEAMEKRSIPPYIASLFVELGASLHSGALLEDYEKHKPATMGKVKLEDFVKEFAAGF